MSAVWPASRPDDLSPAQRRLMVLGVLAAHVAGVWGLMQVREVREMVANAAPMIFDMVAPAAPKPKLSLKTSIVLPLRRKTIFWPVMSSMTPEIVLVRGDPSILTTT